MQRGQIFRRGRSWFLRYWEIRLENGVRVQRRVCKRIAPFCKQYSSKRTVESIAKEILDRVNEANQRPESTQMLSSFIENVYLPHVKDSKRPSTYRGYRDIFEDHLKKRLGDVRLRDFRTVTGEKLLALIASDSALSHTSLAHIKSFLSGVFKFAKREGLLDGLNPIRDVSIPAGTEGHETYAYSLDEIQEILKAISEPARTIVAVAAFTGLRKSELRGLRWQDFAGDEIRVTRTVWGKHVGEPKTRSSRAPVPLLPFLVRVLQEHQKRSIAKGEYIFSTANGKPIDFDNLRFRVIREELRTAKTRVKWHGWHAFRRGLASNLYRLGVADKTIQAILRHANVTTTQAFYIKTAPADAHLAMQRLEKVLGAEWATVWATQASGDAG